MTGGVGLRDDSSVPAFPPSFKLHLCEVRFSQRLVKPVLELVGMGDELLPEELPDE